MKQDNTVENVSAKTKMVSGIWEQDINYLNDRLLLKYNFDIIHRIIQIGDKQACMYLIDGFCKDDLMQKLLQFLMEIKACDLPADMHELSKKSVPYVEVELTNDWDSIVDALLSGVFVLVIEGFEKALLIDSRTYPARSIEEPEKDKVLRGSKDGFVETIVFNTALIRRRIRSEKLCMEQMSAGASSKTDIILCYMDGRVDKTLLENVRQKIASFRVDSLCMNQESLAECLYQRKWCNPFPKFKYTERPDAAAAQILEGNLVILVDNSPSAMILPVTIFDVLDEADDYYFPPITGTYLRLTRFLIALITFYLTPLYLLLMNHPQWVPASLSFILLEEQPNVPLVIQFFLLEFAIDGLKLAAINTPNMLSTPLSVIAAIVLGEFAVNSGWFSSEVMLYMAFVAVANYTQSNYELGYSLKFLRMLNLLSTQLFGLAGFVFGTLVAAILLITNQTVAGTSYLYPLYPLDGKKLKDRLIRTRLNKNR